MQIIITNKKKKIPRHRKCASCYKTKILNNFGFKKNGKIYKSCIKCRNKSNIRYQYLINNQKPPINIEDL